MRTGELIVVFAGGDPPPPSVASRIPAAAYVIAADSGLDHALALGIGVDLLVGDLDSVSPQGQVSAREVEKHPSDKNATDLALALDAALRHRPSEVLVVGGAGGRIDHFLANAALIAAPEYAALNLAWMPDQAIVHVVRTRVRLTGRPGELVSILPYGGPARGVTTQGLRWPLVEAELSPGTSLGVSNEMIDVEALVELREGVVLVVQPGPIDD